jgi:hypothetical protein
MGSASAQPMPSWHDTFHLRTIRQQTWLQRQTTATETTEKEGIVQWQ